MLAIDFQPDEIARSLESWGWIGVGGMTPIIVTAFGDVFLEAKDGVHFLDTFRGRLRRIAGTRQELGRRLAFEGREEFLFADLVYALEAEMRLAPGECYDFKVPPRRASALAPANVVKTAILTKLRRSGEWHGYRQNPSIPLTWIAAGLLPVTAAWVIVFVLLPALFAQPRAALGIFVFWLLFLAVNVLVGFAAYCLTFVTLVRILRFVVPLRYAKCLALSASCVMWAVTTLASLMWTGSHL